jgi:peptidoglycan/xylan/chitin deacetylase (PgdA/CDA1 family)
MYHDVVRDGKPSGRDTGGRNRYEHSWDEFVAHLDHLARRARTPVATEELRPGRAVEWSLTFDDGGSSAVAVGEELARRGWHAYFFITTGLIGRQGFVDQEAVRSLDESGHVVGSHSVTHPARFASLGERELDREWRDSIDMLADILGRPVRTASVPGGDFRPHVATAAARAGISLLFTSEPRLATREIAGCVVAGRYSVTARTSARLASEAAAGRRSAWARQAAGWHARRAAKAVAGRRYYALRRHFMRPRR